MAEKRVDLNTATVQELTQLPGIGPVLAQRVVTYRETIQPYDEPADVTAVSGIGEETYRTIADRLVAAPAEGSPLASHRFETPTEEAALSTADVSEEESEVETEPTSEELAALEEEAEHRMEAVPPGESFSAEPVRLEQETPEEGEEEMPLTPEEPSEERTKEGSPKVEQEAVEEEAIREAEEEPLKEAEREIEAVPPGESFSAELVRLEEETSEEGGEETPLVAGEPSEEDVEEAAPEVEQESVEEEAVLEPDEEPLEEEPAEAELPPVSPAPSAEATPSAPWWRRLSWLWTALLGGFLGMIFALIVWAGINGSLDVSHSPAVLSLKGEVNGVAADVQTLGTDVDGLRTRIEALEGLTNRMEKVEASLDDLSERTSELSEQADALEEEVATMSEELQAVSEDVVTLQQQAERAQGFFSGLQTLLNDIFGEVEGVSTPSPTPTPEGQ